MCPPNSGFGHTQTTNSNDMIHLSPKYEWKPQLCAVILTWSFQELYNYKVLIVLIQEYSGFEWLWRVCCFVKSTTQFPGTAGRTHRDLEDSTLCDRESGHFLSQAVRDLVVDQVATKQTEVSLLLTRLSCAKYIYIYIYIYIYMYMYIYIMILYESIINL